MIYVARAPPVLFLFVQRADVGCSWQQWQFPSSQISQALSVYEVYNVCLQALIQCSRWGGCEQRLRGAAAWGGPAIPALRAALAPGAAACSHAGAARTPSPAVPASRKCIERLDFLQPITELSCSTPALPWMQVACSRPAWPCASAAQSQPGTLRYANDLDAMVICLARRIARAHAQATKGLPDELARTYMHGVALLQTVEGSTRESHCIDLLQQGEPLACVCGGEVRRLRS